MTKETNTPEEGITVERARKIVRRSQNKNAYDIPGAFETINLARGYLQRDAELRPVAEELIEIVQKHAAEITADGCACSDYAECLYHARISTVITRAKEILK